MTRVLVPIADGFEEMETVILVDLFRRAGWEVVLASIQGEGPIQASRGIQLLPDACWEKLDLLSFDLVALPGGTGGTRALCDHAGVQEALRIFDIEEVWMTAICAAPLALQQAGILEKRAFTCYPGIEKEMRRADRSDEPVVRDGHIVTSQGPGTTIALALKLIEWIDGVDASAQIARQLIY